MPSFVVLFRGINVGGARKLPMADVRKACLALGWDRPQTYIQSGNLIVDALVTAEEVSGRLAARLHAQFGWTPEIIVRTQAEWDSIAANPFAGDLKAEARMIHLCVSRLTPPSDAHRALQSFAVRGERLAWAGGALWIDFGPGGVHVSRLTAPVIDRACGSTTTMRNARTVGALSVMLEARSTGSTNTLPSA